VIHDTIVYMYSEYDRIHTRYDRIQARYNTIDMSRITLQVLYHAPFGGVLLFFLTMKLLFLHRGIILVFFFLGKRQLLGKV
jgi:hypothetical protein